eukprot:12917487-Prorocentrum_lima.AAC.1
MEAFPHVKDLLELMPVRFDGIPVLGAALQGRNALILGPFCPEAGPREQRLEQAESDLLCVAVAARARVDECMDHALWSM